MEIPFTVEQFFDVFGTYNRAIWPAQVLAYLLGILALAIAFRETQPSARIVSGILAFFWIWMGVFYQIAHFSVINPAAWIFGVFYIVQGLLLLLIGTIHDRLAFRFSLKPLPIIGGCLILYAMVAYPLLGIIFGHSYPKVPIFGVAPCPTTIFTFGILLWATKSVPAYLLIIPLLWSIVGMSAAVNLRVPQDYGLVVAGVAGTILILIQNRKFKRMAQGASADAGKPRR
ncbi:MAG: DUF6064 family protein [Thermodesulfobacteriota bacterium]